MPNSPEFGDPSSSTVAHGKETNLIGKLISRNRVLAKPVIIWIGVSLCRNRSHVRFHDRDWETSRMGRIIHGYASSFVPTPLITPSVFSYLIQAMADVVKVFCLKVNKLSKSTFFRFFTAKYSIRPKKTGFTIHVNQASLFHCFNQIMALIQRTRRWNRSVNVFS